MMIAPSTKRCFLLSRTRTIHATSSASYPDVSLSTKMCAQRKAGRRQRARRRFACRLYPSHGPLRFITSRSPLPCDKRSAWGGGCHELFFLSLYLFFRVSHWQESPSTLISFNCFTNDGLDLTKAVNMLDQLNRDFSNFETFIQG